MVLKQDRRCNAGREGTPLTAVSHRHPRSSELLTCGNLLTRLPDTPSAELWSQHSNDRVPTHGLPGERAAPEALKPSLVSNSARRASAFVTSERRHKVPFNAVRYLPGHIVDLIEEAQTAERDPLVHVLRTRRGVVARHQGPAAASISERHSDFHGRQLGLGSPRSSAMTDARCAPSPPAQPCGILDAGIASQVITPSAN
jgi:hypothetical protein